jgi:hypothetical protein
VDANRRDQTLSPEDRSRLGAHYTPADWARAITARGLQPLMVWPEAMQCSACAPSVSLLNLLVVDPACGDGEFLLAAADLLAPLLVEAYGIEGIPCDAAEARRQVLETCLVGVDIDPGAVEAARERLGPCCRLHVGDALLDEILKTDGRPTAFLGNPPYLGGGKISGKLGKAYQQRLLKQYPSSNGGADLATYFFLKAFELLEEGGSLGTVSFVATNTISQGRTREAGLGYLLQQKGAWIYTADTDLKWPGEAKVSVSIVHLADARLARRLWPEGMRERAKVFPAAWPSDPPTAEDDRARACSQPIAVAVVQDLGRRVHAGSAPCDEQSFLFVGSFFAAGEHSLQLGSRVIARRDVSLNDLLL